MLLHVLKLDMHVQNLEQACSELCATARSPRLPAVSTAVGRLDAAASLLPCLGAFSSVPGVCSACVGTAGGAGLASLGQRLTHVGGESGDPCPRPPVRGHSPTPAPWLLRTPAAVPSSGLLGRPLACPLPLSLPLPE